MIEILINKSFTDERMLLLKFGSRASADPINYGLINGINRESLMTVVR